MCVHLIIGSGSCRSTDYSNLYPVVAILTCLVKSDMGAKHSDPIEFTLRFPTLYDILRLSRSIALPSTETRKVTPISTSYRIEKNLESRCHKTTMVNTSSAHGIKDAIYSVELPRCSLVHYSNWNLSTQPNPLRSFGLPH